MTRRRDNSGERKLNVRWSTEEWTPEIRFAEGPARFGTRAEWNLLSEIRLRRPLIRKRRQVLLVRSAGRGVAIGLKGPNGSRTTWR